MGSIPVLDCVTCGAQLLQRTIKAKGYYCDDCQKLSDAEQARKQRDESLINANARAIK